MRPLPKMRILATVAVAIIAAAPLSARAQDTERMTEKIEVKRTDAKDPKHPSLQFLRDNRAFIRGQLDRLSSKVTRSRVDGAETLDERLLRLQEMSAALAAARDTVRAAEAFTTGRDLLASITELGELEAQLNYMESLLSDQRERLLVLEQDFLGHQETAMVILIRGLAGKNVPEAVIVFDDNDVVRVELTPEQRRSLEQGGIAQIYHEFVEPREHTLLVSFAGETWTGTPAVPVIVEVPRDRLTFLALNLGELNREQANVGLLSSVWYR